MCDSIKRNARSRTLNADHPHIAEVRTLNRRDWRYHVERSNGLSGDIWEVTALSEEGKQAQARDGAAGALLSLLFFFG